MAKIEPLDREHVPRASQRRGVYPWSEWLVPGKKAICRRAEDFPGAKAVSFQSAAYAAARRMKLTISVSITAGEDGEEIVTIWTYRKRKS